MIDVLNPWLRRTHQRNGVVDRIDAHQGNITDAVADPGVADLGPEQLVAGRIGRVEADMAEPGNAGIPCGEVAAAATLAPQARYDFRSDPQNR